MPHQARLADTEAHLALAGIDDCGQKGTGTVAAPAWSAADRQRLPLTLTSGALRCWLENHCYQPLACKRAMKHLSSKLTLLCFSLGFSFVAAKPTATAWAHRDHLVRRQSSVPVRLLTATWECDRVWNTNTGTAVNAVDTRSQVCALAWSRNVNELVACYGVCPIKALLLGNKTLCLACMTRLFEKRSSSLQYGTEPHAISVTKC